MISKFMKVMAKTLPLISKTEREALEAGDAFVEAEVFQGDLNLRSLLSFPITELTSEEQAFLDNEVDTVCEMCDDYETIENKDLSPEVWDYLRANGFFGLEIPKKYGGKGFSTRAHSEVIMKLASRSITLGVTAMVPNSIGPAKLIKRYGTYEQKQTYLKRLATAEEFPCFALTSPHAGSDAGSITDTGTVIQKDGELFIRLNWEKRYITLSPVATLLGLAFKLRDPDYLLGTQEDLGISLALVPSATEGVTTGRRHMPLGSSFLNGPTYGRDVLIPIDYIIGGRTQAGHGWKMLMESLAEGRGISLPALSVANMKRCTRLVGAYAKIRKQFGISIGKFEGVQDPLARMAGNAYLVNASRLLIASALDQGIKPAVASAILKYEATERSRIAVNDAMDVLGGIGIMEGPSNFMSNFYKSLPIGITVEGANILTRSLIMFGQGSVRCHPCIKSEMESLQDHDTKKFSEALLQHAGYTFKNLFRCSIDFVTFGYLHEVTGDRTTRKSIRKLKVLSARFAVMSDLALLVLGGRLKRKERLSGQFADVLSNLFMAAAALKYYINNGCRKEELPLLKWSMDETLGKAERTMKDIIWKKDDIIADVANLTMTDSETRDNLTAGIYINTDPTDSTGRIETTFNSDLEDVTNAIRVDHK